MRRYYIKTYGCKMNENDSEVMAGLLEKSGYTEASVPDEANVIIINTCCVRQKAEDKVFGFAHRMGKLKRSDPDKIIGICGCIAEKDKSQLFVDLPFIDFVIGPGQEGRIVNLLDDTNAGDHKQILTEGFDQKHDFKYIKRKQSNTAYVRIMIGCNNYCSYCIVPYVRGKEISRPVKDIVKEIKAIDKSVSKEIVLLGQNVNSYGNQLPVTSNQRHSFANLLEEVSKIDGIERIKFMTSHPKDMTDDVINAVKILPKVCEHFHLPLQSGDDEVLKRMNRKYDSGYYRDLVLRIRKEIPNAAITTDVFVGFPGETEEQFENSLKLISELEFDHVNTFIYSKRKGTAAEKLDGHLSENVKKDRLQRLMTVVKESVFDKNQQQIEKNQEVLVDAESNGKLIGRTRGSKIVSFEGSNDLIGKIVQVKITSAKAWGMDGERV